MKNMTKNIKEVVFKTASSHISALTLNTHADSGSANISSNHNEIVLCLHGWLDNAASFIPIFEHIHLDHVSKPSAQNIQFIAIDLPGHGFSSHKEVDTHYHFIDWVYDLLSLFEFNQWSKIHIVGHSMGGMIASAFSAAFPEKVKSLTLIDSIGFIHGDEKNSTSLLRKGMLSRIKALNSSSTAKISPSLLSLDRATRARVLISDLQYHHAELIVSRNLLITETDCQWRSDRKLNTVSPYRLSLAQCKQLVSDIKVPVQVIYGSNGLDFVREGIELYAPLMSCQKIVELEGGHHVHMEKPEETAKLIKEFIILL